MYVTKSQMENHVRHPDNRTHLRRQPKASILSLLEIPVTIGSGEVLSVSGY